MRAWPNSLSLLVTTESQFRVSDQNLSLIDEGTVALYKADIYNIFWASKWAEAVVNWASLTDLRRRGRWIWRLGDGCWPDTGTLHCRTGSRSPPATPSPGQVNISHTTNHSILTLSWGLLAIKNLLSLMCTKSPMERIWREFSCWRRRDQVTCSQCPALISFSSQGSDQNLNNQREGISTKKN